MKVQYFSDAYINETETVDLIEKIGEKYEAIEGKILYKFPSIKELDKKVISPDLMIASKKMGIVVVIVDTMQVVREKEIERFKEKMEIIDNYIYTSLMKNRNLKKDARSLKLSVTTIGYCPNLLTGQEENVYCTAASVIEYLENIGDNCSEEILNDAIASLEQATAMIKPKERILDDEDKNTKAQLLKDIETQIARFDDEQRLSALTLMNGPQRIRGLAGSGKTIILCLKAANLHMMYPNAVIIYTFYTKSLYDYIIQLITRFYMKMTDGQLPDFDNKIQVLHAWGGRNVPGVYYNACKLNGIYPINFGEAKKHGNAFKYVCEKFIEETEYSANKICDYILMDEAQDFDVSFYQLCRSIVKNDHIIWCYDEVQNIFDVILQNTKETFANKYDTKGIDLIEEQKKYPRIGNDIVLHKSYRNVKKILVTAVALGFGIYNDKLIQSLENNKHWEDLGFNVIQGDCSKEESVIIERNLKASPLVINENEIQDCIMLYQANSFTDELNWVANEIVKAIKDDKLLPEDIAVICLDEINSFKYFDGLEQRLGLEDISTYNVLDRDYVKGFYREGYVTLSSIFKAKGNEAAMVFVIGCDVFEDKKDSRTMRNKIFTAFTRAKIWLRISGTGSDCLKQILYEMQQLKINEFKFAFFNKPTHLLDKDWNERSENYDEERALYDALLDMSRRKGIPVDRILQMHNQQKKEDEKTNE